MFQDERPPGKLSYESGESLVEEAEANSDIYFIRNKLNQIQTENEEMKQTIGRLRYTEISSLEKLIEQHSSIINDLRNENYELRKTVIRMRYSADQGTRFATEHEDAVPEAKDPAKETLDELKRNVLGLKNEIDDLKLLVCNGRADCQDRRSESDEDFFNSVLNEIYKNVFKIKEELNDSIRKMADIDVSNATLKAFDDVKEYVNHYVTEAYDWLASGSSDEPRKGTGPKTTWKADDEKSRSEADESNDGKEDAFGLFDKFSKYVEMSSQAIGKELASVWNAEALGSILSSTGEAFVSAKEMLKRKLEQGRSKLDAKFVSQAYERMTNFLQNTIHKVKATTEEFADPKNAPDVSLRKINSVLHKFKKKWKAKLRKIFKSSPGEEPETGGKRLVEKRESWNSERSKGREELRSDQDKDWFIQRGSKRHDRRFDSDPHGTDIDNRYFNTKRR